MNYKVVKKMVFVFMFFSCAAPSNIQRVNDENYELYTKAFCVLLDAKQSFSTPDIKNDTLRIFDHFFIDTTNLYYNYTNLNFELRFVNTINFPQYKGRENDWMNFQLFSSLINTKTPHNLDSQCLRGKKVRFISKAMIKDRFEEYNILAYSPLIYIKEDRYKIYEHRLSSNGDVFYTYIFKLVDEKFEFVERTYHSDVFLHLKSDYMKTINFDQSYEEFIKSRQ